MAFLLNGLILISSISYGYFLVTVFLVNHYREPVKKIVKGSKQYHLYLIIPVLNEETIIKQTLKQLTAQLATLPSTIDAKIIAVDDHSEDGSLTVLTRFKSPYLKVLHRNAGRHQGKGAVINTAVSYLRRYEKSVDPHETVIGVLDADARISQSALIEAVARFETEPEMDMLQTGVSIDNQTNWLTRMQNFDFMGVNNATQQLRNRLGQGIASGNGQFVRLSLALENPWGNSLLEDLEYTIRTWLLGQKVQFTHQIVVQQEGVTSVRALIKQRARWSQGALQCLKYLPALWRTKHVNLFTKVDTSIWMLMPITGCIVPVTGLVTLIVFIERSWRGWVVGGHFLVLQTIFAIILLTCVVLTLVFQRNSQDAQQPQSWWRSLWLSLNFQLYLFIIALTPYVAVYRQLFGRTAWVKTQHGVQPEFAKQGGRTRV